jgi:hypothetical protein
MLSRRGLFGLLYVLVTFPGLLLGEGFFSGHGSEVFRPILETRQEDRGRLGAALDICGSLTATNPVLGAQCYQMALRNMGGRYPFLPGYGSTCEGFGAGLGQARCFTAAFQAVSHSNPDAFFRAHRH